MPGNRILIDVGNTTMKIAFAAASGMQSCFLETDCRQTADSLGLSLLRLLDRLGLARESVSACAVCSVVPAMDDLLEKAVAQHVGCPLYFAPRDLPVPLENRYKNPDLLGADRLVAAWAARELYPESPALVILDFGTVVSCDCVQGNVFLGGLLFPGLKAALAAMARNAAKLPDISLESAEDASPGASLLGRDTAACMRHGILYGFAGMAEGLVARIRQELAVPCTVLAAGGFAKLMAGLCPSVEAVWPDLAIKGLDLLCRRREEAQAESLRQAAYRG